jgi:hypothetical protein
MYRLTVLVLCVLPASIYAQATATFDNLSLPGANTFENGANLAGGFTSGGAFFNNSYNPTFGSWSGFSYSNVVNTTTAGFGNQYAAFHLPSGGGDNSANYGVAFNFSPGDAAITLPARPLSIRITNTTYAGISMRDGDMFAKKFGGLTGNDPDFFKLTIQGRDSANSVVGTKEFFLADFTSPNNALDYIVSQWTTVDLSSLPNTTTRLTFVLESSDNGPFGMNTPAYFAIDNLVVAPEPVSGVLLLGLTVWAAHRRRCTTRSGGTSHDRCRTVQSW